MSARGIRLLLPVVLVVAALGPATATTTAAAVKPRVITITVTNGRPVGGIKRPIVKKGTLLRIVVKTNAGSEVHLHGYDIERKVVKGKPVVMQFVTKLPGRFELELHDPDSLLAQLTVKP